MDMGGLLYEVRHRVAYLTLNRPDHFNSINNELRNGLRSAVHNINSDDDIDVVVITGSGKAFCAGGDVKIMEENLAKGLSFDDRLTTYRADVADMVKLIYSILVPVIAGINGHAFGAGVGIALLCDYRVTSDEAKFGLPFAKRGLIPDWGASYFLPRLVGTGKALELTASGRTFTASEALRLGLVDRVVPAASLGIEIQSICASIQQSGRTANVATKSIMRDSLYRSLDDALEAEAKSQSQRYCSDEHIEGVMSFIEKRPADFTKKGASS